MENPFLIEREIKLTNPSNYKLVSCTQNLLCLFTTSSGNPLVLRHPWLAVHNPDINKTKGEIRGTKGASNVLNIV